MVAKEFSACSARAQTLRVMSNPQRLALIAILSRGEESVCRLAELSGGGVSAVSKHLSLLRMAGLVEARKRGLQVFYSLRCPCVKRLLACIDSVIKSFADKQLRVLSQLKQEEL